MFELRNLSEDERVEYDEMVFDATCDSAGNAYPTAQFGRRFYEAVADASARGRAWADELLIAAAEDGFQRRAKAWLRDSEFVETSSGEVLVKKSARIGVRRALTSGVVGYQQTLWQEMNRRRTHAGH